MYPKNQLLCNYGADKLLCVCIIVAMRKIQKGFTLVEAAVTIAILGVVASLTILGISQLSEIQKGVAGQVQVESTYEKADKLISEFLSFSSVDCDGYSGERESISFSSPSIVDGKLVVVATYENADYTYILGYDSAKRSLNVTLPESAPEGYLAKSSWTNATDLSGVTFTYNDSIGLLTATVSVGSSNSRDYAYVVRK